MASLHAEPDPTNEAHTPPKAVLPPEYLARLRENHVLLRDGIELIRLTEHEIAQAESEAPARLMARVWKDAEARGAFKDPANIEAFRRTWAWNKAVDDVARAYREHVGEFAARCRDDERIRKATIFNDPRPRIAERIERGVIGLASAIDKHKPAPVRRGKSGTVHVSWTVESGWLDGLCRWEGSDRPDPFRLQPEARRSMRQYAEVPEPVAQVLADRLLRDVRDGSFSLPELSILDRGESESRLSWRPLQVKADRETHLPSTPEHQEDDWIPYALVPALTWHHHPDLARRIEDVVLTGVVEKVGPGAEEARMTALIIEALCNTTKVSEEEAHRLLHSLLELRFDRLCGSSECARYAHALDFLASQVSQQSP
jgi:hypothetical protein